jgi:multidrug efflux pump subunit AcrA (membrane-fusion protein)
MSPTLNAASRAMMFEADVPNADGALRAGLFAEADVVLDPQQTAIVVPETAIVEFAGAEKVWTVVDGLCVEQAVQTGDRRGSHVEVIQGLSSGEAILVNGRAGRSGPVEATALRKPAVQETRVTAAAPAPEPNVSAATESVSEDPSGAPPASGP